MSDAKPREGERSTNSNQRTLEEDSKEESLSRKLEDEAARMEEVNLREVKKKKTIRKLEFDSEQAVKEEEDDGLPLKCPICSEPLRDQVATRCFHFFCKHCALVQHEEAKECFVCYQPTTGVFNTAEEIRQKIDQVRDKAKAMIKDGKETVKKASDMRATSKKMEEEVEMFVVVARTYSAADAAWDTMISMMDKVDDVAAKAKDMAEKTAEMMQEANAAIETARVEMGTAVRVMKNLKWNV